MTRTKKDESDKLTLLPELREGVPPVELLQSLGRRNLNELLRLLTMVYDDNKQISHGLEKVKTWPEQSPLRVFNCSQPGRCEMVQNYLAAYLIRINQAHAQAQDLPLIPDLRPENWVKQGETVMIYPIEVGNGHDFRHIVSVRAQVEDIVHRGSSASVREEITDIVIKVEEGTEDKLPKGFEDFENLAYDILSPYIMKLDEDEFLRNNPEALERWISFCGCMYSEFRINAELAKALRDEMCE